MNDPVTWVALAPAFALAGALVNGLLGRGLRGDAPGWIGTGAVSMSFVVSLVAFVALLGRAGEGVAVPLWPYLSAGDFELALGFLVDPLSALLMLVITGVGALIHLYSIGYMHGDDGAARYFSALNLFVAAMSVLVLADSFLLLFVGWEGVGVCSFLLIGFWYREKGNTDAARKAFIVNRVGDLGFLVAMFLTAATFGTLNVAAVNQAAVALPFGSDVLTVIALCFLLGAAGKSAQIPLQVWLPDAMAGPTPVSALIHAATMVTAGVYLVARAAPLFSVTPAASAVVAWVGALTALTAAVAAVAQTDVKRILAYSTISQLGFMFVAAGVGAYGVAVFHLFTHAFFKALLFLGAGSVIHALGGEQDIRRMGGLRNLLPWTHATALVAVLSLSGVPLLAGFFSKDAILAHTLNSTLVEGYGTAALFALLLAAAVLTAFYAFRWYAGIFLGAPRFDAKTAAHVHEAPGTMRWPLAVLAVGSVLAGYVGLPAFAFPNWILAWLEPATLGGLADVSFHHPSVAVEWLLILASVAAAAVGLGAAYFVFVRRGGAPVRRIGASGAAGFARGGLGFDAAYRAAVVPPVEGVADAVATLDRDLVDRGALGVGGAAGFLARLTARLQSGYVRAYAWAMLAGVAVLVAAAAWLGVRA